MMSRPNILEERYKTSTRFSDTLKHKILKTKNDSIKEDEELPKIHIDNKKILDPKLKQLIEKYKTLRKTWTRTSLNSLLTGFENYESSISTQMEIEEEHELWREFYQIKENIVVKSAKKSLKELITFGIKLLQKIEEREIQKDDVVCLESLADEIIAEKHPLNEEADTLYNEIWNVVDVVGTPSNKRIKELETGLKQLQKKYNLK